MVTTSTSRLVPLLMWLIIIIHNETIFIHKPSSNNQLNPWCFVFFRWAYHVMVSRESLVFLTFLASKATDYIKYRDLGRLNELYKAQMPRLM